MSELDGNFNPNPELLGTITAMGISENVAREALFCTGNASAEDALNYIFNNSSENSENNKSKSTGANEGNLEGRQTVQKEQDEDDEWEDEDLPFFKMVFVVNSSLKMGVGKIAAQVGHACLGLYRDMLENNKEDDLSQWEEIGEKKIVLKGTNAAHLNELYEKAKEAKIPAYLVRDAGHTQIPSGSVTVLSLFGLEENVDAITGKLSLL